jgi:hypothetical protein
MASAGHEVRVLDALLPCVHPGDVHPFSEGVAEFAAATAGRVPA